MQVTHLLSQKLTEDATHAMEEAAQTTSSELEKGLNQITRLFLGVLVNPPLTTNRVESILQVIEEGGHTGEILSNLPNLLSDANRSSILTEIGNKIFNHFYEGDTEILTEKLTMVLGIRKPVIEFLLGLTPPLILGVLGSQLRKEKWTTQQFKTYLEEQQADVQAELSPYLTPHLIQKSTPKTSKEEISAAPTSGKNVKVKSNFNFLLWLPWILLGLLLGASWWYIRKLQQNDLVLEVQKNSDSLAILTDDANLTQIEERINQAPDSPRVAPAPVPVATPVPLATTPVEKETPQPKKEEAKTSTPKTSPTPAPKAVTPEIAAPLKSTFSSGSAEVKDDQFLKSMASQWSQNKTGTVIISGDFSNQLTEDQAYAMREKLFQLGIPTTSIRLEKSKTPLQVSLK